MCWLLEWVYIGWFLVDEVVRVCINLCGFVVEDSYGLGWW